MTFQVRVKCLICRKLTDPTTNSVKETNSKALNLLHYKFCAAMKLEFSPQREWDFAEEPFPYCKSCGQRLQRLGELMDQLKSIEEEINRSLATVCALVITSDKCDTDDSDSDPLVTPKLGPLQEYFRILQDKHDYFRSLIIQRFEARVNVERCDNSSYCPGLLDMHVELLPLETLSNTEPAIEDFSETVAEEDIILIEAECKVGKSSNVISGAEHMERYETRSSSLTQTPTTLAFASIASRKPESPVAIVPNADGIAKNVPSQRHFVLFDKSSKTGEYNGFKFKELTNGSYECCTCGFVCARRKGRLADTENIKQHISRAHVSSRSCKECGKVFTSYGTLNLHNKSVHQEPKFQCGLCGERFGVRWLLKHHVLQSHEQGEKPFSCDECGMTFFSNHHLGKHSRVHTRTRATIGVGVESPTTASPSSSDPVRQVTRGGPRVCVECGEVFSSFQTLSKHRATAHHQLRKYRCDPCGVSFQFQSQLKRHEVKHSEGPGESLYSSEPPERTFCRNDHLRNHSLRTHTISRGNVECPTASASVQQEEILDASLAEPVFDGIPDTNAGNEEDVSFNQKEYKVDTSTNVSCGVDTETVIKLEKTWTLQI